MSGHSKWSTIKHKKAKTDAQKGKIFSKMAREIMMAVKVGGAEPEANSRLRLAIQKAKEANMPNDNIKRALQKYAAGAEGPGIEEVRFEAYGPYGVGLIIDTLTDNRNRTVPNLKAILNKNGANMATIGAVAYQFDQKGLFSFSADVSEDQLMEVALQSNVEDISTRDDQSKELLCAPEDFESVKNALTHAAIPIESADITMIPKNTVALTAEQADDIITLIEKIEDDDDVQNVYANFDLPENFDFKP